MSVRCGASQRDEGAGSGKRERFMANAHFESVLRVGDGKRNRVNGGGVQGEGAAITHS